MNPLVNPSLRKFLKPTAVLYLILVLFLTHLPHPSHIPDLPGKDKTLHFIAYFLAALLVLPAYLRNLRFTEIAAFVLGLLVLGILDEVTQPWIGRSCDFFDWLADTAGVITGTCLITGLFLIQRRTILDQ